MRPGNVKAHRMIVRDAVRRGEDRREEKTMPNPKPNYTDLVHQIVRESTEPLSFVEIMHRVNAIQTIATKNPKGTIRNAINQSRLIVITGTGRHGWKYRVITSVVMRLNLSKSDVNGSAIEFTDEVRDLLSPAFFESGKRGEREPVNLQLPNGEIANIVLDFLGKGRWGTKGTTEFWDWFRSLKPQAGDALILRALNGEKRLYAVEFQPRAARDEPAIAARNQQIVQATLEYFRRTASGAALWDISSHLLATGQYKHPVPPDSLEKLWTRDLWEPELAEKPVRGGWVYVGRDDAGLVISSLFHQIEGDSARRKPRAKKGKQARLIAEPVDPSRSYQLKVTLQDSHPAIWRRVQVPGDLRLSRLHGVLQLVMGWTNSHLHQFKAAGRYYGTHELGLDEPKVEDERQARLNQIAPHVKDRFTYEYDFGDSWEHAIIVEKIMPPDKDVEYPRSIVGERACPLEGVGGLWGYRDFLQAFRNPKHPEHEEMLEWVGKKFDPERFDLDGVNGMLKLYPAWRDEE